jgi:amino acid permease
MGAIALYTGLILSHLFLKLDSDIFPIRTYGDIGARLFGESFRHFISILQTLQLVVNVGTLILGSGQSLSQITKGNVSFFLDE